MATSDDSALGDSGPGVDTAPKTFASSAASVADALAFSDDLKLGLSILLHVNVGRVEPATIKLDEETGKLVIKTNREGWRAWCYCYNRRYELGKGELEPVPLRVHTRRLTSSVNVINGGDARLSEEMLQRSLSLLRRYPKAESIDITFATAEVEERLRLYAHDAMSVDLRLEIRHSSKAILKALTGRAPSDVSADETTISEDQPLFQDDVHSAAAARPALVHPAPRRPDRRGSLAGLRSQSMRMEARRGSGASEPTAEDEDDRDKHFWTWKEPPILRRMDSLKAAGAGRGRRQTRHASSRSLTGAVAGEPAPPGSSRSLGRAASADPGTSRQIPEGLNQKEDFWDPLGLMSDINPRTPHSPASAKSQPAGSTQRRSPNVPPKAGVKKKGNTE